MDDAAAGGWRPGRRGRLTAARVVREVLSTVLTFGLVGMGVLLLRLPALDGKHRALVLTGTRRIEREPRDLNLRLEERVAGCTQALAQTGDERRGTLERLQATRGERLRDGARQFRQDMAQGLRRRALDGLASGFKQVAADPTSDQRRRVLLGDLVGEIVLRLKPRVGRMPCTITTEVEPGLELDRCARALGQMPTTLVTNAVIHAFEGRDRGQVVCGVAPTATGMPWWRCRTSDAALRPS